MHKTEVTQLQHTELQLPPLSSGQIMYRHQVCAGSPVCCQNMMIVVLFFSSSILH